MFCEQCEQTASGNGCHQFGAGGKSPEVNAIQDLMVYCLRGLAPVVIKARELGMETHQADVFICETLFATMTNVNFSPKRFTTYLEKCLDLRENLRAEIAQTSSKSIEWSKISNYHPNFDQDLAEQGEDANLHFLSQAQDVDIFSLKLTVLYGVKGLASYTFHAYELGQEDDKIYAFIEEALADLDRNDLPIGDWVSLALKVGEMNLRAMELLDLGHTSSFGHPTPTPVPLNHKPGKAILVSGHDIKQLAAILEQTKDQEITVYTHGELLPAHGYPKLKANYPHLYGHFGTAWQNQTKDFAAFPGAIAVTTNCLMPPHENYGDKIFTVGPVGYPGLKALMTTDNTSPDYSPLIQKALELPGFTEESEYRQVLTGFAHNAVMTVADQVIDAVKAGKIRHFFLVGGCNGAKPGRTYYTEFVEQVPDDCIVLTLACGKFRFFDKELGNIGNLPRLMDVGQCNDAYSAIQIALELANAFNIGVNELPLSMILSWYSNSKFAL
ncbi:MAG: hydroxylamine reductase [Woronichinia naegeliana WA131]|jgi:hydroxylamine reductase|uniref:Hydroxylamine reductase n=1 Tax=Woronichinia naegeliana WA131 TaxID=2824559 RepID=A0A977KXQ8_9CYAN|nr:MAG: hydroxylamine reductase [Woronichinia naegeliana WA131]